MPPDSRDRRLNRLLSRDLWIAVLSSLAIVALAFAFTLLFVKPAPPKKLVLAYAADEGGSRYYARRYQEILKRDGITLDVRQTPGSLTSVKLLADSSSGVDVALVQGGTATAEQAPHVVSLGSVAYTPLWVFHRLGDIDDISELKGHRVAVGSAESGTRALATKLLASSGADKPPTELIQSDRDASIAELQKGQVDALFLVAPAEAPLTKKLAEAPGIHLVSFARADAYVRLFPFLAKLVLPRGVFDLAKDVPERDEVLLSPTANLLARDALHPALAYLLLRAASEVHGTAGLLDQAREFPAPRETGFPTSPVATRYYQAGLPFLQRYLPFWAAVLVDRLWVFLLPIIAVAVPLGRIVPSLVRWRVRSRVFRWYGQLKEMELRLEDNPGMDELGEMLRRLDETEHAVNRIPTPLAYADNLYFFKEHVELVRRRIAGRVSTPVPSELERSQPQRIEDHGD
ncbi:MAG: TAXI family TRAP transporter solute-binding subunit [Myxococcales bacterium]